LVLFLVFSYLTGPTPFCPPSHYFPVSYACKILDRKGTTLLIEHIDLDYSPASYLTINKNIGLGPTIWARYPIDVSPQSHAIKLVEGADGQVLVDGVEVRLTEAGH
jgi:hypothetical protein